MPITEKQIEQHLRKTGAVTFGDVEQLAGIDSASRGAFWGAYKHLRGDRLPGESADPRSAAVMLECCKRAARMVNSGKMSLWSGVRI